MVRLHVCGLIGHQRIGRGVRLVEAVTGELLHQVEQLRALVPRNAVLLGTGDEDVALQGHLLRLLLAHGPAQQVGAAQRVAADHLGDLHHLLLVHHDAVGRAQDRLEPRIEIVDALPAVLALDEFRNQLHRPRAIQRHQGDDVLEAIGPGSLEQVAHATRFELEHGGRIGAGEDPVRRRIVQRDLLEIERLLAGSSRLRMNRTVQSRTVSVVKPRKSNLTRPTASTSSLSN